MSVTRAALKRDKTRRAFEEVCDQIRRELAAGTLVPGDRLPAERVLAEQFGVSRTAVREALKTLEVAGVIQTHKGVNGGPFIRSGNPEALTHAVRDMVTLRQISTESVLEARMLVTNDAIRLACQRGTALDFDAIERDIDRCAELTREGKFNRSAYIVEFYNLLAKATHNEVLVMLVNSLSEIQRQLLDRISPLPRPNVVNVRRRVLMQLRARNAQAAIEEMTAHLRSLNRYMQEQERRKRKRG
jgi:GntR family transcriptional regulator, transcriptional repressor for pyruvate dehydrogenase complex